MKHIPLIKATKVVSKQHPDGRRDVTISVPSISAKGNKGKVANKAELKKLSSHP